MSAPSRDEWLSDLPLRYRILRKIKDILPDKIQNYWHKYRFSFLSLILIVLVYIIALTFVPNAVASPVKIVEWVDLNAGFVSLLLSTLLVLLYLAQHRTQLKQEKIMERQEQWMETNYIADIFIESWSADGNVLGIVLVNAGNGTAKRFRIRVKVWRGESVKLANIVEPTFYNVTGLNRNTEDSDMSSSILWSKEGPQEFITGISFISNVENYLNGESKELTQTTFKKNMNKIARMEETSIAIHLSLLYDDERNETTELGFWSGEFEAIEGLSFESAINNADYIPIGSIGDPVVEPESHS